MPSPHFALPDLELVQAVIAEAGGNADHFAETLRRRGIPHLSFSQVTAVEFCPKRYDLQYLRQVELDPIPAYFIKGKLLHELIAAAYAPPGASQGQLPAALERIEGQLQGEARQHLRNAAVVLRQHLWQDCRVVAVEAPFAMLVSPDLPPCVGVIDLVLEKDGVFILVDHKTGRDFYPQDALQMAIYREYIRRQYGAQKCRFFYDSYRWVNNLDRIRKPAFQRSEVDCPDCQWSAALERIRAAFASILQIRARGWGARSGECFRCPYRKCCA